VLLALFLVCAAVLVVLKAALRTFNIGLAIRNPSAKRSPPDRPLAHRLEGVTAAAHAWRAVQGPVAGIRMRSQYARSPLLEVIGGLPGQRATSTPTVREAPLTRYSTPLIAQAAVHSARVATEWSPQLARSYGSDRSPAGKVRAYGRAPLAVGVTVRR
jgi:hypothetical protein